MSLEIISIGGIDILAQMFNAIAAITSNTSFFHLMGAAEIIGVATCVLRYVQRHDLKDLGKWLIFFVFINGILLTPKVDLLFTDKIYTTKVKKVDNVPVGIAAPFYIFSLGGNALAEMYDKFLAQPNDVRYTNTGMLFGQRLLDSSFNMIPKDARFQANMANFVESCVVPDVEINNKYTYRDIFESKDIARFFFNPSFSPSEARTMFYTGANNSREYITCKAGTPKLKADLDNMIAKAKQVRKSSLASVSKSNDGSYKVLGYSPNMYDIPEDMTSQVHFYLMGSSKSATDIYKQNILVNKLRRDFQFVPAAFDGTSDMVGNAAEQAQMKWRLANLASYQVASKTLPALYTVFSALLVGIFPIIILAMFVTELTGSIIKSYMGFLFSLMLYPVLFAIFNSIVNVLTHQTLAGEDFTISNADTIRSNLADIGATAGYLMMSIPFISFGLIKGLGQAVSSAGSYLGSALSSATSAESSQVSTGNYNYGNMQMENVNGFKTDLNRSFKSGIESSQLSSGSMKHKMLDGNTVYDNGMAKGNYAFDINWGSMLKADAAKQISDSNSQLESISTRRTKIGTHLSSSLTALNNHLNHSDIVGNDVSDSERRAINEAANQNWTNGDSYSTGDHAIKGTNKDNGYNLNVGLGGKIEGGIGAGKDFGVAKATANGSINVNGGMRYDWNNKDYHNKQDTANLDSRASVDNTNSDSSSYARDIGNIDTSKISDTKTVGLIKDIQSSFQQLDQLAKEEASVRSHQKTWSETATLTESNSNNFTQYMNQEFAEFVQSRVSEEKADRLLGSPTLSREEKSEFNALLNEYRSNGMNQDVQAFYQSNYARINDKAGTVDVGGTNSTIGDIQGEHQSDSNTLEEKAKTLGVIDPTGRSQQIRDDHQRVKNDFDKMHQDRRKNNDASWGEKVENTKKNNQEYKP